MSKIWKWVGMISVYAGLALVITLSMLYFYNSNEFFRSLFEGGIVTEVQSGSAAAGVAGTNAEITAKLSFFILIFVLLIQGFAFITAFWVFNGIRISKEIYEVRVKKLENADIFLDLPLYFGLFGTVSAFIVITFNPSISKLIAYSSTLVGIIFSVFLRLALQYPLKQKLITKNGAGKE